LDRFSDSELQAEGEDLSRAVARISSAYFLRCLQLIASLHDGEMLRSLIFQAIVTANTGHLDGPIGSDGYRRSDDPPPDSARRPISVLALSNSLGLPFETVRRHVNKLLASGEAERVKGGVIIPQRALESELVQNLRRDNIANVRRLLRDLRRVGFTAD